MGGSKLPRRLRVERNIYRRASGVYEIGFKDATGKQRWRTVDGGITAARAVRDSLLTQRSRGERVSHNGRLRFGDAAGQWLEGPWSTSGQRRNRATETRLRRTCSTASARADWTQSGRTIWPHS
jgi:hypothetical protein